MHRTILFLAGVLLASSTKIVWDCQDESRPSDDNDRDDDKKDEDENVPEDEDEEEDGACPSQP